MRIAAKEFADDPCSSAKRASMVRAARALLSSVTRLLCVADMADVYRLLASLKLVSKTFWFNTNSNTNIPFFFLPSEILRFFHPHLPYEFRWLLVPLFACYSKSLLEVFFKWLEVLPCGSKYSASASLTNRRSYVSAVLGLIQESQKIVDTNIIPSH